MRGSANEPGESERASRRFIVFSFSGSVVWRELACDVL